MTYVMRCHEYTPPPRPPTNAYYLTTKPSTQPRYKIATTTYQHTRPTTVSDMNLQKINPLPPPPKPPSNTNVSPRSPLTTQNLTMAFPHAGGAPHSSVSDVPSVTFAPETLAPADDSSNADPKLSASLTLPTNLANADPPRRRDTCPFTTLATSLQLPLPPSDATAAAADDDEWAGRASRARSDTSSSLRLGARLTKQRALRCGMGVVWASTSRETLTGCPSWYFTGEGGHGEEEGVGVGMQ